MNVQLQSVEGYGSGVFDHVKVNDDVTFVGKLFEVRLQSKVIVSRDDVRREDLSTLGKIYRSSWHIFLSVEFTHFLSSV